MSICDKDCLHCPFPDCINDEMDAEDWRQAREIEEYVRPKTAAERAIAAKQREYREANRERYNDYIRRYMAERRRRLAGKGGAT